MRKCPLSYLNVEDRYHPPALRRVNPRLTDLADLDFTSQELMEEVTARAHKLSIQGVQPKLSARLNLQEQCFELVDRHGQFILKPQNPHFKNLPENEDVTMRLAKTVGLEVPDHGLIYAKDGQLTYWIRRFDRAGRNQKLPLEDFAQLAGASRHTKYRSSLEQVAQVLDQFCTFPRVEARKLFKLLLFCFLTGNEDQHLKNFSLLVKDSKVQLSPCYDLLNSTIVLKSPREESALPLAGKKSRLKKDDFLEYAKARLRLNEPVTRSVLDELSAALDSWADILGSSFLPVEARDRYHELIQKRRRRLGL